MGTRYNLLLKMLLIAGDFLVINIAYAVAFLKVENYQYHIPNGLYAYNLVVFNLLWFLLASILGLYGTTIISKLENIFRQTGKTALTHFAIFMTYLVFTNHINHNREFLLYTYMMLGVLFLASRFLLTTFVAHVNGSDKHKRRIAIVGYNEVGMRLEKYFNEHKGDFAFAGFFDNPKMRSGNNYEGKIISSIDNCVAYAVKNNIREIYSTILPQKHNKVDHLVEVAERHCVRVKFVPDFTEMVHAPCYVEYLDKFPVISLQSEPLEEAQNRAKKRAFDILFSLFVTVFILSWLMPILAILIKLESKGPVFFRQLRSGKDNKPFWCYKFRSMKVNNESDATQATKNDARVTKLGAFMRKTSIDELPQFFNVLIGNMSVVGPRPHMLKHTEQYSALISRYMIRQFLQPGITGWAQVNGLRGETKEPMLMQKRVVHDIWYMENWSLMLDIKIAFLTAIQAFKGDAHAY